MSMALPLILEPRFIPLNISEKVALLGRFFFLNDEKFFLKGVTYGPFSPSHTGGPVPEAARGETDCAMMADLGATCVRTFTPPPNWLLDIAASYGLRVIIGIPWAQHISFLDSLRTQSEVRETIVRNVEECRRHAATFAYLIGNEIPLEIVLVGSNFPSTEYLETDFTGFLAFNVYLHRDENFRCYLFDLQQECLT